MAKTVEEFIGVIGFVQEENFDELTNLLEGSRVVEENEPIGTWTDYVETTYEVNGKHYMLWYQVQAERTPDDWDYTFGFELAES